MQFDLDAVNLNIRHRIDQIKRLKISAKIEIVETGEYIRYKHGKPADFFVKDVNSFEDSEKKFINFNEGKIRFIISERPEEMKYILQEFKHLIYLALWGPRGGNLFKYGNMGDDKWIKDLHNFMKRTIKLGKKEDTPSSVSIIYQRGYIFIEKISNGYVSLFIDGEINWAKAKIEKRKIISKIYNGLEGLL